MSFFHKYEHKSDQLELWVGAFQNNLLIIILLTPNERTNEGTNEQTRTSKQTNNFILPKSGSLDQMLKVLHVKIR